VQSKTYSVGGLFGYSGKYYRTKAGVSGNKKLLFFFMHQKSCTRIIASAKKNVSKINEGPENRLNDYQAASGTQKRGCIIL